MLPVGNPRHNRTVKELLYFDGYTIEFTKGYCPHKGFVLREAAGITALRQILDMP
jgi:hypothetical protein